MLCALHSVVDNFERTLADHLKKFQKSTQSLTGIGSFSRLFRFLNVNKKTVNASPEKLLHFFKSLQMFKDIVNSRSTIRKIILTDLTTVIQSFHGNKVFYNVITRQVIDSYNRKNMTQWKLPTNPVEKIRNITKVRPDLPSEATDLNIILKIEKAITDLADAIQSVRTVLTQNNSC